MTTHPHRDAAKQAARRDNPRAVIQDNGGDDCLVWESRVEARNDDGKNAIARISEVTN